MSFEYEVTVRKQSNKKVDSYSLLIDETEVEEPVELEEGEHSVRITGESFKNVEKTIQVDKSMRDVIVVEPEDGILVAPDDEQLEGITSPELQKALDELGHDIRVNKASNRFVQLISPYTESIEIEIVDSGRTTVNHDYEYIAKIVYEDSDSFNNSKEVFRRRYESPVEAVAKIEKKAYEQRESIF